MPLSIVNLRRVVVFDAFYVQYRGRRGVAKLTEGPTEVMCR
jgi:hypothetical protein